MGYRRDRTANRFDNYRQITARRDSAGACGHPIHAGDTIGWHRNHGAKCATCWARWAAENEEAELVERMTGFDVPDLDDGGRGGW